MGDWQREESLPKNLDRIAMQMSEACDKLEKNTSAGHLANVMNDAKKAYDRVAQTSGRGTNTGEGSTITPAGVGELLAHRLLPLTDMIDRANVPAMLTGTNPQMVTDYVNHLMKRLPTTAAGITDANRAEATEVAHNLCAITSNAPNGRRPSGNGR